MLAAHVGDFDEIVVRQPPRPSQHRSCHQYVVVERKPADRLPWNCACPTQLVAEQSQGLRLRPLHQSKENIVEYGDLGFIEAMSISQKQLRHLPQYSRPALGQSAIQSAFQLRDQSSRFCCGHCRLGPSKASERQSGWLNATSRMPRC
ncbi:MAG TPA: hypothetical protein VF396_12465 [Bradyrhizobium sp.]